MDQIKVNLCTQVMGWGETLVIDRSNGKDRILATYRRIKNTNHTWEARVPDKLYGNLRTHRLDPELKDYEVLDFIVTRLRDAGYIYQ